MISRSHGKPRVDEAIKQDSTMPQKRRGGEGREEEEGEREGSLGLQDTIAHG